MGRREEDGESRELGAGSAAGESGNGDVPVVVIAESVPARVLPEAGTASVAEAAAEARAAGVYVTVRCGEEEGVLAAGCDGFYADGGRGGGGGERGG